MKSSRNWSKGSYDSRSRRRKKRKKEEEKIKKEKTQKEENDGSKESSRKIWDLKWEKEVVKFEEEIKKLVP